MIARFATLIYFNIRVPSTASLAGTMTKRVLISTTETQYVTEIGTDPNYKHEVVWLNAIVFLILHIIGVYGLVLAIVAASNWTWIYGLAVGYAGAEGVTIGAHRLYTHRSFKATPMLRLVLVMLQTVAGQNSTLTWVRDHRLHHQYSDTDADPHNARRGFFFSHVGWLMCRKHPAVAEKGRHVDISDVQADPIVQFQKKYYLVLYIILAMVIPVALPILCWNESFLNSLMVCYFGRLLLGWHGTWLVNSAAHLYGTRPYDKELLPAESWFVSLISLGEGWHNYHHVFPWDYKASEYGMHFNASATIIELFEKMGLAYDLKKASQTMLEQRIMRTGDGTHYALGDERSRRNVTAAYGVMVHPLNPTYRTAFGLPNGDVDDQTMQ